VTFCATLDEVKSTTPKYNKTIVARAGKPIIRLQSGTDAGAGAAAHNAVIGGVLEGALLLASGWPFTAAFVGARVRRLWRRQRRLCRRLRAVLSTLAYRSSRRRHLPRLTTAKWESRCLSDVCGCVRVTRVC
jgi:hypothetical protein